MNIKIVSIDGNEKEISCSKIKCENGFIVVNYDNKQVWLNPAKISMVELSEIPKVDKIKKLKEE